MFDSEEMEYLVYQEEQPEGGHLPLTGLLRIQKAEIPSPGEGVTWRAQRPR